MKTFSLIFYILFAAWFGLGLMYYSTKNLWSYYSKTLYPAQTTIFQIVRKAAQVFLLWVVFFGIGAWFTYWAFIGQDNLLAQLWALWV